MSVNKILSVANDNRFLQLKLKVIEEEDKPHGFPKYYTILRMPSKNFDAFQCLSKKFDLFQCLEIHLGGAPFFLHLPCILIVNILK